MSRWAIIPMRGLAVGKSRLAGYLDDGFRRDLNAWLLEGVLGAVRQLEGGLTRCLVAAGAEDVVILARRHGASVVMTGDLDLNASMDVARSVALACNATQILGLVADLPHITSDALSRFTHAVPAGGAGLVCDKERSGTTGFLVPASCRMRFMFGPRSLERHRNELREHEIEPVLWKEPSLSFDLDTPDDYRIWRRVAASRATLV